MANGFSQTARQPSFIALAVIAALGWVVAIWSATSSSRQQTYLNERIQQLEATQQVTASQLDELRRSAGTVESLQNQMTIARGDLASLKQQQEQSAEALAKVRSETEAADRRHQEMQQAHARVQRDLATARETLTELERRRAETARAVGEITASRDRVMAELQEARERSTMLQQQLAVLSNELASRQNDAAALEGRLPAGSGWENAPLETGSAPVALSSIGAGQQPYRCDDNGSGWTCSPRE